MLCAKAYRNGIPVFEFVLPGAINDERQVDDFRAANQGPQGRPEQRAPKAPKRKRLDRVGHTGVIARSPARNLRNALGGLNVVRNEDVHDFSSSENEPSPIFTVPKETALRSVPSPVPVARASLAISSYDPASSS